MELMQKKEIKKPKQNHTSDISFMQILKKKKTRTYGGLYLFQDFFPAL